MPQDFQALARDAEFLHRFRHTLVDGDDVFAFGSSDHGPGFNDTLVCLDRASGKTRWAFGGRDSPHDILGPACADERRVYVGRNNGFLYALRRDSGEEAWRFAAGGGVVVPALHRQRLIASASEGLVALDPDTGAAGDRRPWNPVSSSRREIAVPHEALLFQVSDNGAVFEISGAWRPGAYLADVFCCTPACMVVGRTNQLSALDLGPLDDESRRCLWSTPAGGDIQRLVSDGRTVWISSQGGRIGAFDALTGESRWSRKFDSVSSLATWRGRLFLDLNARVAALDGATGESTGEFALEGSPYGALVAAGGALYAGRAAEPDVLLHAVPLETGAPRWKTVIGGFGLT